MATTDNAVPVIRSRAPFYTVMAALAGATVFVGFAQTFYLRWMFDLPMLSPLFFAHGIAFTSWFLLFGVQTSLVAAQRTDIHRKLGIAGALLAFVMVVLGSWVGIYAARTGFSPEPKTVSPLAFLIKPLGDMAVFAALVGAAVCFRKQPAIHKRLMLLATISILTPAVSRWPIVGASFAMQSLFDFAFFAACIGYDFTQMRRVHPVFLWGSLLIIISLPLRFLFSETDTWLAFARWVTS
jgi:hypothetical protein